MNKVKFYFTLFSFNVLIMLCLSISASAEEDVILDFDATGLIEPYIESDVDVSEQESYIYDDSQVEEIIESNSYIGDNHEGYNSVEDVIYAYADSINNGDKYAYISLFVNDERDIKMELADNVKDEFFLEESVEILNISELSVDTGVEAAGITDYEMMKYSDIVVCYVEENVKYKEDSTVCVSGLNYYVYVISKEDGFYRLIRVSVPQMSVVIKSGENFRTQKEIDIEEEQDQLLDKIIESESFISNNNSQFKIFRQKGVSIAASSYRTQPAITTIYFRKEINKKHYGKERANINFNSYLKNVIFMEWYVSYYEKSKAYLRAGAMASKMYAWHNTIYPKRLDAPYYACMYDDSYDQNYEWNAYSRNSKKYRGYVDETLSFLSTRYLVTKNTETIFETQYRRSAGSYHSGIMSASGCWELAKKGYKYNEILKYYYSNSKVTNYEEVKVKKKK